MGHHAGVNERLIVKSDGHEKRQRPEISKGHLLESSSVRQRLQAFLPKLKEANDRIVQCESLVDIEPVVYQEGENDALEDFVIEKTTTTHRTKTGNEEKADTTTEQAPDPAIIGVEIDLCLGVLDLGENSEFQNESKEILSKKGIPVIDYELNEIKSMKDPIQIHLMGQNNLVGLIQELSSEDDSDDRCSRKDSQDEIELQPHC